MTKTQLPRTGVSSWSADADVWPGRVGINAELAMLNANVAIWAQGTTATRPVAAYAGRFYFATETLRLWYDNGTAWTEASPVGGGGTPTQADIGDTGVEGSSRIAARADHQHAMLAPAADPAAMSYSGVPPYRGASATVARADHAHFLPALPLGTLPPALVSDTAGSIGVSSSVSREDHVHMLAAPWQGSASGSATTLGDGAQRPIPLTAYNPAQSVNWGGPAAGRMIVPYNGIYLLGIKASIGPVSGGATIAAGTLSCNAGYPAEIQYNWTPDPVHSTGFVAGVPWQLSAGEGICVGVSGAYAGTYTWSTWLTAALLRRL